ncbi:MAG TPA: hypothetical protein VF624_05380 [Tepidisphaeraceae bacterium]|jgi:hypothetical protein
MRFLYPLAAVLVFLTTGCTSYRYEVVQPEQTLGVQKDRDLVLQTEPAEVRLRQVESRCVVIVANPTTRPFEIEGSGSTLVDPTGQSRAISPQLVPPGAYVKYILPPVDQSNPRGPQLQLGFGVMADAGRGAGGPVPPPSVVGERRAVYLSPGGNIEFWEWSREGQVRLLLSLKQDDAPPRRHEILIRRVKN